MSTATNSRLAEFYILYILLLYRAHTYMNVETQRFTCSSIYPLSVILPCINQFKHPINDSIHPSISNNIQSMHQFIHQSVQTPNLWTNSSINQ